MISAILLCQMLLFGYGADESIMSVPSAIEYTCTTTIAALAAAPTLPRQSILVPHPVPEAARKTGKWVHFQFQNILPQLGS